LKESGIKAMTKEIDLCETLATVRDNLYGAAEAIDKFVQTQAKAHTREYDVTRIAWVERSGAKGPFEFADAKTQDASVDYQALVADLKAHDGKLTLNHYFYWIFTGGDAVGRKPTQYAKKVKG
jgi:hypothetical protein